MTTTASKSLYGFKPAKGDEDIVRHLSGLSMGVSEYLRALIRDDMNKPNGKWRRNPNRPKSPGGIGIENEEESDPMRAMLKVLQRIESKMTVGGVQIYSNEQPADNRAAQRSTVLDDIESGLGDWNPDFAAA